MTVLSLCRQSESSSSWDRRRHLRLQTGVGTVRTYLNPTVFADVVASVDAFLPKC
jgi:hypothetical protein